MFQDLMDCGLEDAEFDLAGFGSAVGEALGAGDDAVDHL
jgi:hypothetical protein